MPATKNPPHCLPVTINPLVLITLDKAFNQENTYKIIMGHQGIKSLKFE